jgi:tRNA-specific 2-thiouridylase
LDIPFTVLDLRKEFKRKVIGCFLDEYKKGNTPNPCVVCNKEIKFGFLLKKALAMDADFIATGHYARLGRETLNPKSEIRNYRYKLLKGKDKNKDQSYFLWRLNQKQLRSVLFPLGNYTRAEVERLAKKFKLPVLRAKKSVEICFVPKTINDFLRKHIKEKPGKIADIKGKVLGAHQGLWFYTIGQRKGIGLSGGPYYVIRKDIKKNVLVVGKNEKDLVKKDLIAEDVNWISGKKPKFPLKIKAKTRSRQKPASAVARLSGKRNVRVVFDKPQRAVTPGQSAVFYKGEELLGGGIIC